MIVLEWCGGGSLFDLIHRNRNDFSSHHRLRLATGAMAGVCACVSVCRECWCVCVGGSGCVRVCVCGCACAFTCLGVGGGGGGSGCVCKYTYIRSIKETHYRM